MLDFTTAMVEINELPQYFSGKKSRTRFLYKKGKTNLKNNISPANPSFMNNISNASKHE